MNSLTANFSVTNRVTTPLLYDIIYEISPTQNSKRNTFFKGPLISATNKKKILVGVMEMGKEKEGCIDKSIVFHRVSPQGAWIINITGTSVQCTIDPKVTSSGKTFA